MSLSDLKLKRDIVLVNRNTRGKFPGERAKKGSVGIVWSQWTSNNKYGTKKLSILDEKCGIVFTTRSCVEKIGEIKDFKNMKEVYKKFVDKNYLPVFCIIKEAFFPEGSLGSFKIESSKLKIIFLGKQKTVRINATNIHYEDIEYLLQNPSEIVYSIRMEPWLLERHGIV